MLKLYLCNLRSNMCNRSFQPGLHPSFATLFSTSSRTIVASSLQKEGPFGSNNRFKPFCNLGLNGVSTLGSTLVANPVANKKTPRLTLGVCNLGLEPWFTQSGTGGAKLHREFSFEAQYTFLTKLKQVENSQKYWFMM